MIIAVAGLAGAGKTVVTQFFEQAGYTSVYLPRSLFDELDEQDLPHTEEHERRLRERIRAEEGMAAFAKRELDSIRSLHEDGDVVLESMYSWEEYLVLKEAFGDGFRVCAVWAPPATRYERLSQRAERSLSPGQARSRDHSQIESLHQAGPIAMADFLVNNDGSLDETKEQVGAVIATISSGS